MHPFSEVYNTSVIPRLKETQKYTSVYAIPRVTKVVINMGVGDALGNAKSIEDSASLISQITGQKPVITKARKAIAGFKIRENMPVGLKTTLRETRMRDFLIKLITVSLPRTRDFRGLPPTSITADGNLNIGIKDSIIFPEAAQSAINHSLQITIVSTARNLVETRALYEALGFVFQSEEEYASQKKRVRTHRK